MTATQLKHLYDDEGMSLRQIASDHRVSRVTLRRLCEAEGMNVVRRKAKTKVRLICAQCGKTFDRFSAAMNQKSFCSKRCYNVYRDGRKVGYDTRDLTSKQFLSLKKAVFEKFPVCVLCGSKDHRHAHHIFTRREAPELSFVFENLVTICRSCHCSIKGKENLYRSFFMRLTCKGGELLEHLTPIQSGYGNQQPSRSNVMQLVDRKVQRLTGEESQTNKPDTSAAPERDDIVRACEKSQEVEPKTLHDNKSDDTNDWYLIDSTQMKKDLLFIPRVETEFKSNLDFETMITALRVYFRFGLGYKGWRFIIKSTVS